VAEDANETSASSVEPLARPFIALELALQVDQGGVELLI
jgi:hypothetical protein